MGLHVVLSLQTSLHISRLVWWQQAWSCGETVMPLPTRERNNDRPRPKEIKLVAIDACIDLCICGVAVPVPMLLAWAWHERGERQTPAGFLLEDMVPLRL